MDRDVNEAQDREPVEGDVVPEGAPRGGITVPDANDSGTTTPPISGWGESVAEPVDDEDEGPGRSSDPRGR